MTFSSSMKNAEDLSPCYDLKRQHNDQVLRLEREKNKENSVNSLLGLIFFEFQWIFLKSNEPIVFRICSRDHLVKGLHFSWRYHLVGTTQVVLIKMLANQI